MYTFTYGFLCVYYGPMGDKRLQLKKKKTALYPGLFSLRISADKKQKAKEMSEHQIDVADSIREIVEPAIESLYEQFKRTHKY